MSDDTAPNSLAVSHSNLPATGVEAISRAAGGASFEFHPKLDGSESSLYNVYIPMGLTAENVAERCQVSREAQDERAVVSQNRAVQAQETGHFDKEIVPVRTPAARETNKAGEEVDVRGHGLEGRRPPSRHHDGELAQLRPVFKEEGTVTAGNACPLNDGAAAALVMSERRAKDLGLTPKVRIRASHVAAVRPEIMGLGPIPAVKGVLEQAGMRMDDIDVVELNRAFAAQVVPCKEEWGIDDEQLNPFGGARPPIRHDRRPDH
jgi:acetyl-CoA C-acetyltransferase